jgi:TolB-like protein
MKAQKVISVALMVTFLINLFAVNLIFGEATKNLTRMTIAVVDFSNTKKDSELEYLVKGIPESIITYLGKRGEVHIVERSRLESALDEMKLGMSGIVDEQTAVEVGKAVGADAVMVGSFLQIGDRIRINARLLDVGTGKIIAAEHILGGVDEIFELMDRTSEAMWVRLVDEPIELQPIPITPKATKRPKVREKPSAKPLYKRWWFWGILAGAAGGAAYVAASQEDEEETKGTLMITVQLP